MVRRLLFVLTLTAALAAAALPAAAAEPAATTTAPLATAAATTTTATTTPAPPAAPAAARISLTLAGAYRVQGKHMTVIGRRMRVDGRIAPYVAGETIAVRVWRGHTLLKQATVRPRPTSTQRTATFSVRFASLHSGTIHVFAVHARTATQVAAKGAAPALSVLAARAGPGTRSPFVALLQQRLTAVGYAVPHTGVFDPGTQRAVIAFRKVNGMARVAALGPTVVDRLMRGVGGFHIRYPNHGRHVEANLHWQVLALIDKGKVVRTYVTSSGKPSTPTVLGSFRFYEKTPGTNAKGMVDSNFFIRGYAIHGYVDVPTYNASHGCLRVPIPDAPAIFAWVHIGDRIDVYY
jgi:peptidoglycan hydrolase-like protein with peptidoglycan-binding domain